MFVYSTVKFGYIKKLHVDSATEMLHLRLRTRRMCEPVLCNTRATPTIAVESTARIENGKYNHKDLDALVGYIQEVSTMTDFHLHLIEIG